MPVYRFLGCEDNTLVNVNVTSDDPVNGIVTGGGIYHVGDTVTITATPATDYRFLRWVDVDNDSALVSSDSVYTFIASENVNFQAKFLSNLFATYWIEAMPNDTTMGYVIGSGVVYTSGDIATVTAVPYDGYHFENWIKVKNNQYSVVGTDNVLSLEANYANTYQTIYYANFAINQYTINGLSADTVMGTVTGSATVNYLTEVTLTATPNTGYHLVAWSDGDTNLVRTFIATADTTVTATFDTNIYNVTVAVNDTVMGSANGPVTMKHFQNADYVATANYGYSFVNWTNEAGVEIANTTTLNIAAVSGTTAHAHSSMRSATLR